jgi:CRISPR-associated protein Csm3
LFGHLLTALQMVQDDYLGGQGSRGSGKVVFEKLTLTCRRGDAYEAIVDDRFHDKSLAEILTQKEALLDWVRQCIPTA